MNMHICTHTCSLTSASAPTQTTVQTPTAKWRVLAVALSRLQVAVVTETAIVGATVMRTPAHVLAELTAEGDAGQSAPTWHVRRYVLSVRTSVQLRLPSRTVGDVLVQPKPLPSRVNHPPPRDITLGSARLTNGGP